MQNKPYLTSNEVAALLRVSPVTIRQWSQKGMLEAEFTPGGHRRFMIHEIERFAVEHGISLHGSVPNELRILVVDDDDRLTRYMVELLQMVADESEINLQVEVAVDGFDAGAKVFRFRPHIILLDLLMPGMDGFEVCRGLKADPVTRPIRVVGMTGFASDENVERIINAGAEACLNKPIDQDVLVDVLGLSKKRAARTVSR